MKDGTFDSKNQEKKASNTYNVDHKHQNGCLVIKNFQFPN